ncbi:MAG: hypothetical protein QM765_29475 [Myxococcales bacterium]
MKRLTMVVAAAVAAVLALPSPGFAAGTTFSRKPLAVGTRVEERGLMQMTMSMKVEAAGKAQEVSMDLSEREVKSQEYLALEGDAPSKVRTTWQEKTSVAKENGVEKPKPSELAGKTFVVEAQKNAPPAVAAADGQPLSEAVVAEVQKEHRSLGKPDPVRAAMPARALSPGQKVPELAKAVTDALSRDNDDGMKISNVSVTFKGATGDEGRFDVTLRMAKAEGPVAMTIDLKGELKVSCASSLPNSLKLAGPIAVKPAPGGPKGLAISGKGQMSMELSEVVQGPAGAEATP